jgi:hypothetical protein
MLRHEQVCDTTSVYSVTGICHLSIAILQHAPVYEDTQFISKCRILELAACLTDCERLANVSGIKTIAVFSQTHHHKGKLNLGR